MNIIFFIAEYEKTSSFYKCLGWTGKMMIIIIWFLKCFLNVYFEPLKCGLLGRSFLHHHLLFLLFLLVTIKHDRALAFGQKKRVKSSAKRNIYLLRKVQLIKYWQQSADPWRGNSWRRWWWKYFLMWNKFTLNEEKKNGKMHKLCIFEQCFCCH